MKKTMNRPVSRPKNRPKNRPSGPSPATARPLVFAGIADDLTGGIELASLMVRGGVAARLLTARGTTADIGDAAATVIGLKVRVAPKATAVAAVRRALAVLAPRAPRQLFQKYCATFDSTPRGNIGPIADVLMAATGAPFTAFCPAFPEVDRTVYAGHLFAIDQLISRSPKRHDPLTPMREPDLVRVLAAQTAERVGLIRHQVLSAGPEAVAAKVAALTAAGVRYAISDAVDEADLACLAAASLDWRLMTGGSSVAVYYPDLWRARGDLDGFAAPAPLPKVTGRAAVIAGSCAERTAAQLAAFAETGRPVIHLAAAALIDPAEAAAATEAALAAAVAALPSGPVAVATTADPAAVAAVQARAGVKRTAAAIERALGRIAEGLAQAGVTRFVIAGGETSGAVLDALGVRALEVGPFEAPGLSRAVSTGPTPISLHLKSGKLGPVDMFARALAEG
jgi:uncharacterized protein YgbK (DUF1537 family)